MSIIRYIIDCRQFAKAFPFKKGKGKRMIWLRNVLYLNAQPKYLHGRIITWLLDRR